MPVRLGCEASSTPALAVMARPRSRPMNWRTWLRSFSLPPNMSAAVSSAISTGLHLGGGPLQPLEQRRRPDDAGAVGHAEQRVLASERHQVQILQRRERGAEMGADRVEPEMQFALVVLGVEIDHRPRLGQRAEPVAREHMRGGELQDQDAFADAAFAAQQRHGRRAMRSLTAQSRGGTDAIPCADVEHGQMIVGCGFPVAVVGVLVEPLVACKDRVFAAHETPRTTSLMSSPCVVGHASSTSQPAALHRAVTAVTAFCPCCLAS